MSTVRHTSDRILAYGHDAILLKTRCMVLEQAGFHVDAASSAEEFRERIAQAKVPYRLFLLGHSIPPTEQSRIVASVVESATLVYQLAELTPPLQLISDLRELLCEDDKS
jgi:hypothetical protein